MINTQVQCPRLFLPSLPFSILEKGHFSEVEGIKQESLSQCSEARGTSALKAEEAASAR